MKYIWKRDLPFAKAGKIISFTEDSIVIDRDDTNSKKIYYNREDLDYLLSEGWIEEVKPRELWLVEDAYNGIVAGFEDEGLAIMNRAERFNSHACKVTKVQVID